MKNYSIACLICCKILFTILKWNYDCNVIWNAKQSQNCLSTLCPAHLFWFDPGWAVKTWLFILFWVENLDPHMAHKIGLIPSWTDETWQFKCPLLKNSFLQIGHEWFFFPSWTASICRFKWKPFVNPDPQRVHKNGFLHEKGWRPLIKSCL